MIEGKKIGRKPKAVENVKNDERRVGEGEAWERCSRRGAGYRRCRLTQCLWAERLRLSMRGAVSRLTTIMSFPISVNVLMPFWPNWRPLPGGKLRVSNGPF